MALIDLGLFGLAFVLDVAAIVLGVDVANYFKPAERWVCMGLPVTVTHWMPLPEPPKR